MFPRYSLHGDGIRAALMLIRSMIIEGRPLSQVVDEIPETHIIRVQLELGCDLVDHTEEIVGYLEKRFKSWN